MTVLLAELIDPTAPDARLALLQPRRGGALRLSYGELRRRIDGRALELRALGLPTGARVGIGGGNGVDALVTLLACGLADLVAVPINLRMSAKALRVVAETSGLTGVVNDVDDHARLLDVPALDRDPGARGSREPRRTTGDPGEALVMYTSGSMGTPKAVPITHRGYVWAVRQFDYLRPLEEARAGLVAAPLWHMNGQFHALQLLSCGATVVLMEHFEPSAFGAAIVDHGVVRVTGVPTMLALLVRAVAGGAPVEYPLVESVAMGSAPFPRALAARARVLFPNAVVTNGWGTTETGPAAFGPHPEGLALPELSVGHPLPDIEWRLEGGPHADEGVLWLRTPMTLPRYLGNESATRERVRDGGFSTGDVMRRDAQGFFYFVGRADDMMNVGGENLYPLEVERLLERHPGVEQAAVVPLEDSLKGQVPVAFVVPRPDAVLDADSLKRHALENGPAFAHPRHVRVVDALPLNAANKVDRRRLALEASERFAKR